MKLALRVSIFQPQLVVDCYNKTRHPRVQDGIIKDMGVKTMTTKYSDEFKNEALALARETSVSNASAKLGVSTKTIYGWRQQRRLSEQPEAVSGDTEAQNRQLRREVEELRQANTILKKALGFFAKG